MRVRNLIEAWRSRLDRTAVVFAIAVVVRALITRAQQLQGDGLTPDGCYYVRLAENLMSGRGYTLAGVPHTVFPPGVSLAISAMRRFVSDGVWSAQLVSILSFYAAAILLFVLLRRTVRDRWVALLGSLVYLFAFPLFGTSVQVNSEPLYALLLVANLGVMLALTRGGRSHAIAWLAGLGLLNGCMFLTRPEGLFVFLANVAVTAHLVRLRSVRPAALIALAACFVISVAPYVAFLHSATGTWKLSGKDVNWLQAEMIEKGHDPLLWERNSYRLTTSGRLPWIDSSVDEGFSLASYVDSHRSALALRVAKNTWRFLRLLFVHFGPLALLLPLALWWRRGRMDIEYLGLLVLLSGYLLLFAVTPRYWSSGLPTLVLLVALLADRFLAAPRRRGVVYASFALALGLSAFVGWRNDAGKLPARNQDLARIAAWISDHVPSNELVVARDPELPFLGDRDWIRFPWFTNYDAFVSYMRSNGLSYFVVSDEERRLRPFLLAAEADERLLATADEMAAFPSARGLVRIMRMRSDVTSAAVPAEGDTP